VARIWREHGIQPWRAAGLRFSTDPELEAKVVDIVALHLDPPENAVVLCVDEESQIQALDRSVPVLPMAPHLIERRSSDHVRNGTTTLFAAPNTATGKVTARCQPCRRHGEFLVFLRQVARVYPGLELHLVMDNYAAQKHPGAKDWLEVNPRTHVHSTPTYASWMNMVEIFFGIAERQAVRRGPVASVRELTTTIRRFIDHYDTDCQPFTWTKTADQILRKATRPTTSETRH
jgi:transposase